MTGVFLIIILAVVWYVAGIFHSFALMLYVAVNLLLIAGMYILTRIYKKMLHLILMLIWQRS